MRRNVRAVRRRRVDPTWTIRMDSHVPSCSGRMGLEIIIDPDWWCHSQFAAKNQSRIWSSSSCCFSCMVINLFFKMFSLRLKIGLFCFFWPRSSSSIIIFQTTILWPQLQGCQRSGLVDCTFKSTRLFEERRDRWTVIILLSRAYQQSRLHSILSFLYKSDQPPHEIRSFSNVK